jgi:hypothetical protein
MDGVSFSKPCDNFMQVVPDTSKRIAANKYSQLLDIDSSVVSFSNPIVLLFEEKQIGGAYGLC